MSLQTCPLPTSGNHCFTFYLYRFARVEHFIYMVSYNMWFFVSDFSYLAYSFQSSSILLCISIFHFLLLSNNLPLYGYAVFAVFYFSLAFGLFLLGGSCEYCCCEHSCTSFFGEFQFCLGWNCGVYGNFV